MSSNGFRFDDLAAEQYDEEWPLFGLDDDQLKCGSPPSANISADMGLTVPMRTCPSPLAQIPTREPYPSEQPPKLSPVSAEQQTFITLSNHVPVSNQQVIQPMTTTTQCPELAEIEYALCADMGMLPSQPTSPVLISRSQVDAQAVQPSTSGLQHNGGPAMLQQQPAQPPTCIQTVNGQWFVQAQVQHVQTSGGTVIAVVPNFCRGQGGGNPQTVSTQSPQQLAASGTMITTQQPSQTVVQTQSPLQMQHQQILHHPKSSAALPVGVVSNAPQQSHSVMQHLLSQPTMARQQMSPANSNMATAAPKSKQRALPSRANGRKKNASQGGTLGAVLAKANKLAAASSTDASLNQILPPSQGIEMRLSLQSSEEVANLSREISRLQNHQAAYNVDHSAEIKELESKRAQIFFEALAQQHKDKDLLSAVNPQSVTSSSSVHAARQRNNAYTPRQQVSAQAQIHHVQPSTSYEHQQPVYEAAQTAQSGVAYQSSYQVAQYPATSQALQRSSYDPRANTVHVQQTPTPQYSYRAGPPSNQTCAGYVQEAQPGVTQPAIVVQPSSRQTNVVVTAPERRIQRVPFVPPPRLRTSAETAAVVNEKRRIRTSKVNECFSSLHSFVKNADTTAPFESISDALLRLLPFHVFSEPDISDASLEQFDHSYIRHCVHLNERKNRVERRLRSALFKEAAKSTSERMEECLLLSLDLEYEHRLLEEDRRAAALNIKEFVSSSSICEALKGNDLPKEKENRSKISPIKSQWHFEYRPFSEADILSRVVSPFPASEPELEHFTSEGTSEDESVSSEGKETSEIKGEKPNSRAVSPKKNTEQKRNESHQMKSEGEQGEVSRPERRITKEQKCLSTSEAPSNKSLRKGARSEAPERVSPGVTNARSRHTHPVECHSETDSEEIMHSRSDERHRLQEKHSVPRVTTVSLRPPKMEATSEEMNAAGSPKADKERKSDCIGRIAWQLEEESAEAFHLVEPKQCTTPNRMNRGSVDGNGSASKAFGQHVNTKDNLAASDAVHQQPAPSTAALQPRKIEAAVKEDEWVESSPSPELTSASLCVVLPRVSLGVRNDNKERQQSCKNGPKKKRGSLVMRVSKPEQHSRVDNFAAPVTEMQVDEEKLTNGVHVGASEINFGTAHQADENIAIESEEAPETRPPIRIKIALVDVSLRNCDKEEVGKRKEKKKKKKRKHRSDEKDHHCQTAVASCSSDAGDQGAQLVASTFDDPSHSRILMRISRRKNARETPNSAPSPMSCFTPRAASSENGRQESRMDVQIPPLKVPKLKIRLGGKRCSPVGNIRRDDTCSVGLACVSGKRSSEKPDRSPARGAAPFLSRAPSVNSDPSFPPPSMSAAPQFSPESEISDDEASMQLRAQTDSVMNQLNDWGSNVPVSGQSQAEAFSRLVGSNPLMNPLLGGLMMPSSPWLLNPNLTHAAGLAATQPVPWLMPPAALMHHANAQHRSTATFEDSE